MQLHIIPVSPVIGLVASMAANFTAHRCVDFTAHRRLPGALLALQSNTVIWRHVMPTQFEILEAEVLKLVSADRALLAEHLIASLDEDNEIESAWTDEVERRVAEVESGVVVGMSFEEVIAQARSALK